MFRRFERSNESLESRTSFQGHSLEHNNEINKMLGKVWKTATEHEKKNYEEKATADKVRYLKVWLKSPCLYRQSSVFFPGPCTPPFYIGMTFDCNDSFFVLANGVFLPAFSEDLFRRNSVKHLERSRQKENGNDHPQKCMIKH